ncbi:MAG: hypothetical protein DHS20C15_16450 [Planctomycetota bacterium]|nr:MAG: hypothetical protein DHS20C15_16450 [Planctomycetota bacterium]
MSEPARESLLESRSTEPDGLDGLDLQRFEREGFLVLKGWLPPRVRQQLHAGWAWSAERRQARPDRFVDEVAPAFDELVTAPEMLEIPRTLLGPDVAIYFSRLMVKDEAWSGEVPPHQEAPYFHGGQRKLMVFVPLGPMHRANGGLYVVPGAHRYGALGRVNDHEIDLEAFPGCKKHFVDMQLGDVLVFDFLMWHGSDAAQRPAERPLFHVVYQPASDGSCYGDTPRLACGTWRTEHFLPFHFGVTERPAAGAASGVSDDHGLSAESLRKQLDPEKVVAETGHSFVIHLEDDLTSDAEGCSRVVLWEDNKPLPLAHVAHAEIRGEGAGRYSHWKDCLFFSSSDNSDPRTNGRLYSITLRETR